MTMSPVVPLPFTWGAIPYFLLYTIFRFVVLLFFRRSGIIAYACMGGALVCSCLSLLLVLLAFLSFFHTFTYRNGVIPSLLRWTAFYLFSWRLVIANTSWVVQLDACAPNIHEIFLIMVMMLLDP